MDETRNRVLVGERISRTAVEAARGATLADVDAAIAALDYEAAATQALGRAKAGEPVPVDTIARILPGIELPAIACALIAIAPDRARLVEPIRARRFARSKDAAEIEAITLYAAWRAGADRAHVIPELRRLSARQLTAEAYALLATIAAAIDDPNVAAATKPIASFAKEYAKQAAADDKAMTAPLDAVIASLPAEVEMSGTGGFTVRGAKQVGRNDPCPCGSGQKYKKCCADKPVAAPSPIPGLSWEEFLGARADQMTNEHVAQLALRDLPRIELARLAQAPLAMVFRRYLVAHEWTHAEHALGEIARRNPGEGDGFREELAMSLLEAHEIARAREHVAQLPAELAKHFALELAIHDGPAAAWPALVAAATEVVGSTDRVLDIDLAYALLRAEPAVGIIAARACIGTWHVDDAELLLEAVEDGRDRLGVPPTDAAWDVVDALTEPEKKQKAEDGAQLKAALADSSTRIDQLERTLSAMKAELDDARTRPATELQRAPERTTGLEAKVRELEALIREGNAERRDLRKQLEAATPDEPTERREGPRARRATVAETDDDVGDDVEAGGREVAIPRFERRAIDALGTVPAAVAAEAMRTIGTLAAGDAFAWRGVKQAKDMPRPTLMARVGIHHRLIFHVGDGVLEIVDLVTREQLLTTLKRLRSNR